MKRLTCELCGSNDFVKEDGLFVCQSCGTKYSVEEARKLMIEGTVEVKGTVQVDNTANINNFLSLAEDALEKEDLSTVADYTKRILEMDPNCTKARIIQFEACTSTGDTKDIIKCGKSAIKFASDDEKGEVNNTVYSYYAEKALAITKAAIGYFVRTDKTGKSIRDFEKLCAKANDFSSFNRVLDAKIRGANSALRNEQDSFVYLCEIPGEIFAEYPAVKEKANEWLRIRDDVLQLYKDRYDFVSSYSASAKTMPYEREDAIIAQWKYQKEKIRFQIAKADQIIEQEKQSRIADYWEEHAEERTALEEEKRDLKQKIDTINERIQQLPETNDFKLMEKAISRLYKDIKDTGVFERRKKKELQEKLDAMIAERNKMKDTMNSAVAPYIKELRAYTFRMERIEEELARDR